MTNEQITFSSLFVSVFAVLLFGLLNTVKIEDMKTEISALKRSNSFLKAKIYNIERDRTANVTVTAYSPREIETGPKPFETAFMTAVANRTIALPWFLIQQGWTPGKCVYLKINHNLFGGIYKINDMMNERYQYRADIFFFSTDHAVKFGQLFNIDMIYLGECP